MIEGEVNDTLKGLSRKPKKPIPLPRKNVFKTESCNETHAFNENSNKKSADLFNYGSDWKTASEIVQEKTNLMKSEVQKFEKSVRNIISRKKSNNSKSLRDNSTEFFRSNSLPDDNIFCSISFNSPLSDDFLNNNQHVKETSESDLSSNDGSYYTSELPPPYPPPDLPDESVYNETASCTSSDGHCSYMYSSDSNSFYEDLTNYHTGGLTNKSGLEYCNNSIDCAKSDTWLVSGSEETSNSRYDAMIGGDVCFKNDSLNMPTALDSEVLKNECCNNKDICSNNSSSSSSSSSSSRSSSNISKNVTEVAVCNISSEKSSVVNQFDPLNEKESQSDSDVSDVSYSLQSVLNPFKCEGTSDFNEEFTSPFQNHLILSSLPSEGTKYNSSDGEDHTSCLIEGHYGKVRKIPKSPLNTDSSDIDLCTGYNVGIPACFSPPPVPPRRFDSISCKAVDLEKSRPSFMRWSSMKRVARIVAENIENRTSRSLITTTTDKKKTVRKTGCEEKTDNFFPPMVSHSGVLFKTGGIQRWGVLLERKLTLFVSKDSPDVKETIAMDNVLGFKAVNDSKISVEGVQIYCFEVIVNYKSQPFVFGALSASERHIWMRKLLESLTPNFPAKLMSDYTKAGLCFAKEGISSEWQPCSILLHDRSLYLSPNTGVLSVSDLRKARYISIQANDQTYKDASEKGPMLLIDMQNRTLYLQMDYVRETKAWESAIISAAQENGPSLSQQQLTKDNIPTIVDKCLNFIHTHGSLSEGIYRRNGSNQMVTKLLSAFRSNSWAVQLTRDTYNEFDVSSVLKRFFRDLPEPLFISDIHQELKIITEKHTDSLDEKLSSYSLVLKKLPIINYLTAKRLIGHLYFIDKQKDKNLMGVDNLSAIWGPTLLHVQEEISLDPNWSRVESSVLNDLITHFPKVFEIDDSELDREMKILKVLENYHNNSSQVSSTRRSGDLKIWIYLNCLNKEECINISVSPQKLSEEICRELSHKVSQPSHLLCLEEVVCSGSLCRPLHFSERVFDNVLRWGYWDDSDRKDNCLILKKSDVFHELLPFTKPPVMFCEELKFADQRTKIFKTYQFEFSQAKLCCYKDASCSVKVGEWKIEDIIWYLGYEPKRNPHTRWAITFIEKKYMCPRSKDRPFFGNTVCGTTEEQKLKLLAAMVCGQYPQGILPTPNLI